MSGKKDIKRHEKTPIWEWIIAAVGLALVLISLGVTLYRAVTEESTPPNLSITAESVERAGDGYLVNFRVTNSGTSTAAALVVEGTLRAGDEIIETSTATMTYAPANSERHGALMFTRDPNLFKLHLRPLGYEKP